MSYNVIWKRAADGQLASIWMDADDRAAISHAARALDRRLALNPMEQGESRPSALRIAFELPLAVLYEIREDQRIVQVVAVWKVRKRRGT